MAEVVVEDDAHTYVTREATEEQWDGDDTHTDHSIRGIREAVMYSDLTVDFDLVEGQTYYLLYATYQTGCSFYTETGKIEYIGLYRELKVAKENLGRVQKHNETEQKLNDRWDPPTKKERRALAKDHESYSVPLVTEKGQKYLVHVPWHGYFERLEGVDIEPVTLL